MLERIGRSISNAVEKSRTRILVILFIFIVFGAAGFVVEWILDTTQLSVPAQGLVDGIIIGGGAAFTTWFLLTAARKERVRLRTELEQEAQLNHEIRNALEVIAHAGYLISDLNLKKVVSDSVNKIDAVLRERKPPEE
jgi:hypothetical protein